MQSVRTPKQRIDLRIVVLVVVVFVGGFALGNQFSISLAQGNFAPPPEAVEAFEPFWQAYAYVQSSYIDEVETNVLVDGAITGMINALGDQYSGYMDPELFELLNDDLDGEIEGIGVVIRTIPDTGQVEVVTVLEGTPAMLGGLLPGDIFVEVEGEPVTDLTQLELAGRVRGPSGSTVNITMLREEELVDFELVRERIDVPVVEWEMLDNNIGYVRLTEFSSDAREKIDVALNDLIAKDMEALIFDLRGNPGGLLNSSIDVASAFIEEGVILEEEFGDGRIQTFNANGNFRADLDVPIIVMVNEASASASELVSGALQDTERATILGETTVGKGTVQTWQALINGGGIRLTIARWKTPDGHWIHEQGITPDIVVEWEPETFDDPNDIQLDAAVEYLTTEVLQVAE